MTPPTDQQLKVALAKMLPEHISFGFERLIWEKHVGPKGASFQTFVGDTELLHICWLIEQTLVLNKDYVEYDLFLTGLIVGDGPMRANCLNWRASWQQRTIALAKVKGIEL